MKKFFLLFVVLHASLVALSQSADSVKKIVSGAVAVTNNGISVVPAFSLDKPAAIFDLAVRKNRFSFEPEWAFDFNSKPWYFIFWLRYKTIESSKFDLSMGFQSGFLFNETNAVVEGANNEYLTTSRFFVEELTPTYKISGKISIGIEYQHSQGFNSILRQSHFIALNCGFSDISLGNNFFMKAIPEAFFLKNDNNTGFYANSTFTLTKKGFPLFISSQLNEKLHSDIPSKNFLWNVSLTYSL